MFRAPFLAALLLCLSVVPSAQGGDQSETSGRPAPAGQTCYDVTHYDLALRVDPEARTIAGELGLSARLVTATETLVLDLHRELGVEGVTVAGAEAAFRHVGGEIRITPARPLTAVGEEFELRVRFGGKPRVAANPPWTGGFTWSETDDGRPWIATSCQQEGADLWWPCKDQPDDEPDTMDIRVTVPDPLVVASNGRLVGVEPAATAGWSTHHWHVSTPINTYGVALNIAPYATLEREYTSVDGTLFPVVYWVLPANLEKGKVLMEDILRQMRFMEETFGPYPFRIDKYGVAETPHMGMEHQSIIAYGNEYKGNPWGTQRGFDFLHLHEFAHEWWANLVTARNWNDFWIHESFATYSEALYVEKVAGFEAYKVQMSEKRRRMENKAAIAPREPRSTAEMYFSENAGAPGIDIYNKGSWVLHSLRWLVGDEDFFRFLRRMAYPTEALERVKDGGQCRFATTEELVAIAEACADEELDWFFELYIRQPELPKLESEVKAGVLHLAWQVPDGLAFPMPVPVRVDGTLQRVAMPDGKGSLTLPSADAELEIDPDAWLLVRSQGGRRRR